MTIDITIVILYLLATLVIGLYAARKVATHSEFSTGGKQYSSLVIMATLFVSSTGGGFTTGLAEKTFSYGLVFVLGMWGFSLKELLIAKYIAPRMDPFKAAKAETVGDMMELGFGKAAKVIAGLASLFVCGGIIGAQITVCGNILYTFLGVHPHLGSVLTAAIVVCYSSLGGIKSVVAVDLLHFSVKMITLPLVLVFGIYKVGGIEELVAALPPAHIRPLGDIGLVPFLVLFLSFFFGETLIAPYVQRLLIGKSAHETAKGTLLTAVISLFYFLMVGAIGLIALHLDAQLEPHLALPFVIKSVMPVGLKGLAIAAMLAVVMSAADSFLNATAMAVKKDVLEPLGLGGSARTERGSLLASRLVTLIIGGIAIIFSLVSESGVEVLLYAYQFWTPFILVPLIAVVYGVKARPSVFIGSAVCGIVALLSWNALKPYSIGIDGGLEGVLFGILINALCFQGLLYLSRVRAQAACCPLGSRPYRTLQR